MKFILHNVDSWHDIKWMNKRASPGTAYCPTDVSISML